MDARSRTGAKASTGSFHFGIRTSPRLPLCGKSPVTPQLRLESQRLRSNISADSSGRDERARICVAIQFMQIARAYLLSPAHFLEQAIC